MVPGHLGAVILGWTGSESEPYCRYREMAAVRGRAHVAELLPGGGAVQGLGAHSAFPLC